LGEGEENKIVKHRGNVPYFCHMNTNEALTLLAIALSPLIAVLITFGLQVRKEKRDDRRRIFALLIAYRESVPLHREYVNALNLINVYFRNKKDQEIRQAWEALYQQLQEKWSATEVQRKRDNLLHAMGRRLGYDTRGNVLAMYYLPQGHLNTNELEWNLRHELLRVLKATKNLDLLTEPEKEK
jgi:hypothetical protein